MSAPCGLLDEALKTSRPYVKIATGLVKDSKVTTIDGKAVVILADVGATLDRDGDGAVLEIKSSGAFVEIYDLEITGATGAAGADGIQLNANGGMPQVSLSRLKIDGNQGAGVAASGGTLSIVQSTISANQGGGVVMSGSGTVFTIVNNFIYGNGNASSASAGGVLAIPTIPTGTSKLEFNTIVDNRAKNATLAAGGVLCDQGGFVASHNIIFRNTGGSSGNVQTIGACTYGDSFNMPGTSTVDNAPGFSHPNEAPFDFHLTAASPAALIDTAGACTGVDFDGDVRPIGAACDLGADERRL